MPQTSLKLSATFVAVKFDALSDLLGRQILKLL